MKLLRALSLCLSLAVAPWVAPLPATATTISNSATSSNISSFGRPDTQTYGQVFAAPVTGTMDSFTLTLNGGVGSIIGAVAEWNGTSSFGFGGGVGATLFTSAPTNSGTGGPQTFTPGVSVAAGALYVAFLTVFGVTDLDGTTSMPAGTGLPGGGYFVWNNTSSPFGNTSWNYFADYGNALFSASFTSVTAVPLPAGGFLLLSGLLGIGLIARRRQA